MDERDIYGRVRAALEAFFEADSGLLDRNVNERSLTHKLAEHLQHVFPGFNVDCEYNRHGEEPKQLSYCCDIQVSSRDLEARTVFPDIVVHERGNDERNLLVIEVKKTNSTVDEETDLCKLKAFTGDEYHYRVGLFLRIDVGQAQIASCKCFSDGEAQDAPWTDLEGMAHGE